MEFPVRCFTCGAVIGDRYEEYKKLSAKLGVKKALDEMGIKRYCCRRMFISHVDFMQTIKKYKR